MQSPYLKIRMSPISVKQKRTNFIQPPSQGPLLALAPMAELTHLAFRQLVAELGGCDLFYTEMVNSRITSTMPVKTDPYCWLAQDDRPCICQLVGNDPEKISRSIERLLELDFAGFDINMGCSRTAIMKRGWGAALMENSVLAAELIKAAKSVTNLPVSAKMRSMPGHDSERLLEFCARLQDAGLDAVILHPRSPQDGFKRPAKWKEIRDLAANLRIPVWGNGDVSSSEDAFRMWKETGCAGIMIGRAAAIRPWIFWEIKHSKRWPGDPLEVLNRMAVLTETLLPKEVAAKRFRLFCSWFLRNWPFYHHLYRLLRPVASIDEMVAILSKAIPSQSASMVERPNCLRL